MSTNRAFIKAFRRDAAEPTSPAHLERTSRRNATAPLATSAQAVGAAHSVQFGSTVAYVSPGASVDFSVDAADGARRPATWQEVAPISEVFPLAEPRATEHNVADRVDRTDRGVKRPLSSFLQRPPARTAAEPADFRPGTTIASYQWPRACRQLLARHRHAFDGITDALLSEVEAGRRVIGILGCFRGVGCTTTTLCLAARAARRKRRVAAVDGHFQSPQFAASLSAMPNAWWQDVLEGSATLTDAMIHAEDDRFDVLVLDPQSPCESPQRAHSANTSQIAAAASELRAAYELVLVDLGAFFDPNSQPLAFNLIHDMQIDAVVAVTDPHRNDPRDFDSIARRLAQQDCKLLGTVLNRVIADDELELERHVS